MAALLALLLFSFGGILWTNRTTANAEIISAMESILSNVSGSTTARSEDFVTDARASSAVAAVALTHMALSTPAEQETYFGALLRSNPSANGAFYGSIDGSFVYVSRSEAVDGTTFRTKLITVEEGSRVVELVDRDTNFTLLNTAFDPADEYDPRTRPWFTLASEKSTTILTDPYVFFTSQRPGVTAATPVYSADGSIAGVVGIDVELSDLSSFLSELSLGENGSAFIFNANGELIASEDFEALQRAEGESFSLTSVDELDSAVISASFEASANLNDRLETFTVDDQDSTFHAFVAPIANTDWILGVALDEQDFLGEVRTEQQRSNTIALALGLLGIAAGWRLIQNVTGPLTELKNRALAIEAGNYVETGPSDAVITELRTTSDAFDHMVKTLLNQRSSADSTDRSPTIDLLEPTTPEDSEREEPRAY
ncbi:MAG: hypothetical protein HKO03_11450 [Acidimicrobiia bacterium]|nr:hypothetical protein [Acidimicrobiia bacterium]